MNVYVIHNSKDKKLFTNTFLRHAYYAEKSDTCCVCAEYKFLCVGGRVWGVVRTFLCERACVGSCVRAWVRVCVRACVRACVCPCVHACVHACVNANLPAKICTEGECDSLSYQKLLGAILARFSKICTANFSTSESMGMAFLVA